MHIQAGTVIGGITLSSRPYIPLPINRQRLTSLSSPKTISGAAQSRPSTQIFIYERKLQPMRVNHSGKKADGLTIKERLRYSHSADRSSENESTSTTLHATLPTLRTSSRRENICHYCFALDSFHRMHAEATESG